MLFSKVRFLQLPSHAFNNFAPTLSLTGGSSVLFSNVWFLHLPSHVFSNFAPTQNPVVLRCCSVKSGFLNSHHIWKQIPLDSGPFILPLSTGRPKRPRVPLTPFRLPEAHFSQDPGTIPKTRTHTGTHTRLCQDGSKRFPDGRGASLTLGKNHLLDVASQKQTFLT